MIDPRTFAPGDPAYSTPCGAVASGTAVCFTVKPRRSWGYSQVVLCARFEGHKNAIEEHRFHWTALEYDRDCFSGMLETGDYVGLIWYTFRLERLDGRSERLGEFQLTVYDAGECVPDWFGDGVTYQIFPDRFRRKKVPDPTGMVGGRSVHANWREEPEYRSDERGEIRNRDFFGGSLEGVQEKLPYLQSLGVNTLYFCPIFEGAENHRYGTGDYEKIDPMLGEEADFRALCQEAHSLGMRVLLDGVFNHTGFVSKYFNGDGAYNSAVPGAAQSEESPYRNWYHFIRWPDQYDCWWGIYSLPAVNESESTYLDYMINRPESIVRRWLRAGADGWRLDVADELPDSFIHALHTAVRETKTDGVVLGEVWEDGSSKIAYGVRRKHILGGHCDGLMNYPLRNAMLDYLLGGDAQVFRKEMERLRCNYPSTAFATAMNALGTHDTPRILTLLGVGSPCLEQSKTWRANYRLTEEQYRRGKERLKAGELLLYAFPGSPTVYYGDEAGMEGFEDPFNRRPFPWGEEDRELMDWFAALGRARNILLPLRRGDITYQAAQGHLLAFQRSYRGQTVLAAANMGENTVMLPLASPARDVMSGQIYPRPGARTMAAVLPPRSALLLVPLRYKNQ